MPKEGYGGLFGAITGRRILANDLSFLHLHESCLPIKCTTNAVDFSDFITSKLIDLRT